MPWPKELKNSDSFIVYLSSSSILYNHVIHIYRLKTINAPLAYPYDGKRILEMPKNV